jgi:hypothetical protein
VSLMTKSQASRAKGRTVARVGAARAGARQRTRQATAQARPLAVSARIAAGKGIHHARIWAAPRLERTGHALEDRVAPRMAAMLSAAARRIEPAPARRRRRWPVLAAGLVTAAGLSATAAYLLKRRNNAGQATRYTGPMADSRADGTTASPDGQAAPEFSSEANGRARTGVTRT